MLQKQPIDISFAQGLDTKTDPKRVQMGNFLQLQNTVFNKGGLLQKRNGYGKIAALPDATYSYLTTFNGNLTALGQNIAAYDAPNMTFGVKGPIQPVATSTLPLLRNNFNQTLGDAAVAANGLICTVYLENNGGTITNKYVIADATTGQNITAPVAIPVSSGTVSGGMRVFTLGNFFIIIFTNTIAGSPHLQYIAINIANPTVVTPNTDIASGYTPSTTLSWDGVVNGTKLFIAYNTTSGGQSIKVTYLTSGLTLVAAATFAGLKATSMSLATTTTPFAVYISIYDSVSTNGFIFAVDTNLNPLFGGGTQQTIFGVANIANLTSVAMVPTAPNQINVLIFYDMTITGGPISSIPITGVFGSIGIGATTVVVRGAGLASKGFLINNVPYFLSAWASTFQPTYFLINGATSTQAAPVIAGKLAYQNGGGLLLTGLPSVTITGTLAQVPYLFKDLIQAVNKGTNLPASTQAGGIYSQTGVNLASFNFTTADVFSAEIGGDLHLSGGFLWMYDGYLPVEHNFFLYPEGVTAVGSATAGSMSAQQYFYQVTYEWSDNQGNIFRSSPSIPVTVTLAANTSVLLTIPTLRLTMKTSNPVKIVIYRWSIGQQNYYQTTSITSPLLNNPSVDTVTFTDTNSDATILGNNLIYTTGGVLEDVNAPASNLLTLFDTRLWLVDAEDPNLLWYSKQVIEATPVEMSDLLTLFVPPTTATAGTTGPITAISVLDDKLIIFKKDAIFYINGTGPDNAGFNSQYSQAIFVTSTVGCTNQKSIVLMPNGLMFQSDKGIWLLGRDLSTTYIGAPVESFTQTALVLSAVNVPATNQVRFTLDSGITLMFDYYYGQWGTFVNVPSVSSTIFQGLHTFINSLGQAFQETPGKYLDGSSPTLMMFQTGPLRLGALQNYQRAYFFYLLGQYFTPHKLSVSMYYDYAQAPQQLVLITPSQVFSTYGTTPYYGSGGYGGNVGGTSIPPESEDWRVFFSHQRCQAVSIQIQEVYDASQGIPAGAGFTLSGLNVICGFKKAYRPQPAAVSAG